MHLHNLKNVVYWIVWYYEKEHLQCLKDSFVFTLVIFVTDNLILVAFLEPLCIYAVIFLRLIFLVNVLNEEYF